MNRIIKMFMERDGMTLQEAKETYSAMQGEIVEAMEDSMDMFEASEEVEDILADYGFEPDYLDDLLL